MISNQLSKSGLLHNLLVFSWDQERFSNQQTSRFHGESVQAAKITVKGLAGELHSLGIKYWPSSLQPD